MKHTFSSLAPLALIPSTSDVASLAPQLVLPGILETFECIALDVIAELLLGDPLAIAFCEAVGPLHRSFIKTRTTTIVRPTTVTVTTTRNRTHPTITSRTIMLVEPVVTTRTITKTQTARACPAPTLCVNQGIDFAHYRKTLGGGFANFHPEG
ncbi:uncharacterized protein TrAFT101_002247 [Trichoderma asperellum]|uniref:Uncharacterized protein n=1 Tax=Trichoderma asperellum (strain ATCC 204424 / CBS 433.97 / NBRC 101777) TaxID=1042311 RepID=A0A2T3ZFZ6_TRIA4|nr:hypothetical protein M441DRAFT_25686 [Trichoderma asperellum CBS 433.97]PTB43693.1 hypothetical protein M441DRAFT_25686 [Trichoderma asperellum CBS 433.97]UKZ86413.1 hypothetical protein TrAFT101_002247 [Trichoderma asperellum]